MMTFEEAREKLHPYFDGELPSEERAALEAVLEREAGLRDELAELAAANENYVAAAEAASTQLLLPKPALPVVWLSYATLLSSLLRFVTQEAFRYMHEWEPGDCMLWDNLACLHCVMPWDYENESGEQEKDSNASNGSKDAAPPSAAAACACRPTSILTIRSWIALWLCCRIAACVHHDSTNGSASGCSVSPSRANGRWATWKASAPSCAPAMCCWWTATALWTAV